MTNNAIHKEMKVKGQKTETVASFRYLGTSFSDDGQMLEVLSSIAQAGLPLTKLKSMWRNNNMSLGSYTEKNTMFLI